MNEPTQVVEEVLRRYSHLGSALRWTSLGNCGGFSGAGIWRVESSLASFCLKAWPLESMPAQQLKWIHGLMSRGREMGLPFVPTIIPLDSGTTLLEHAGRMWDLTEWMPGTADYHLLPSPERLRAVCRSLAELHLTWRPRTVALAPCPAITRRLDAAQTLSTWVKIGWHPPTENLAEPVQQWVARAWELLESKLGWIETALEPFRGRVWPVQPCLCDIWHDHVFFVGDRLTAIIDYGGVKIDQIAVDLARLLGSLVGDDPSGQEIGLDAYSARRSLSKEDRRLVHALDQTGVLAGLIAWLRWLYHEQRHVESSTTVAQRLAELTRRAQAWKEPYVGG